MNILEKPDFIQAITDQTVSVATVIEAMAGQAIVIQLLDGNDFNVFGHGSSVPVLNNGDQVIVLLTHEGAVILDRLRAADESPKQAFTVNPDGSLSLDNTKGIEIKTPDAHITISPSGGICLNGKNIKTSARQENILRGGVIRIN